MDADSLEQMSAELETLWAEAEHPTPRIRALVERMVRKHPSEAWPRLARAEVLGADGAQDEAVRAVADAVALAPADLDVALSAAEQLVTLGRLDQAMEHLGRVSEPASAIGRVAAGRRVGIEGRIRERRGELGAAEGLLTRAVEILPEYEYHWYLLGALLLDTRQLERAEAVVLLGLERFPDDRPLRNLLADIRRVQTRQAELAATVTSTGRPARVRWSRPTGGG